MAEKIADITMPVPKNRGNMECPNCQEPTGQCACMRNKCVLCGEPVGNITFTVCDDCWEDKEVQPEAVEQLCNNCDHISDRGHELDPLGTWGWCVLWGKDVLEDSYTCKSWAERVLTWPEDK